MPLQASYGVSVMGIWVQFKHVLTIPHFIWTRNIAITIDHLKHFLGKIIKVLDCLIRTLKLTKAHKSVMMSRYGNSFYITGWSGPLWWKAARWWILNTDGQWWDLLKAPRLRLWKRRVQQHLETIKIFCLLLAWWNCWVSGEFKHISSHVISLQCSNQLFHFKWNTKYLY